MQNHFDKLIKLFLEKNTLTVLGTSVKLKLIKPINLLGIKEKTFDRRILL
jgi:hypothetical protein